MKTILLINSSYRKKNTYNMLKQVESMLEAKGYETRWIHLKDHEVGACYGCEACIKKNKCPLKDEAFEVMEAIIKADGVVIGTPVYLNNMSGMLKLFLDRTCNWFHRSEVVGKPVVLLATTMGSGLTNTLNSLEEVMIQWGGDVTAKIGRKHGGIGDTIQPKELEAFIKHVETGGKSYKATMKQVMTFNVQKALAMKIMPQDKAYWETMGWDKKQYFEDQKASWVKRQIGNMVYKILEKKLNPIEE